MRSQQPPSECFGSAAGHQGLRIRIALAASVAAMVAMSVVGSVQAASAAPQSTNWPQEGFNAQHTANNAQETILTRSNVVHLHSVFGASLNDGGEGSAGPDPILANGALYAAANEGGVVVSINATTGAVNWAKAEWAIGCGGQVTIPAFAANQVWIGQDDPGVVALSTSGVTVTCIKDGSSELYVDYPPTVSHGIVYDAEALVASTGHVLWQSDNSPQAPAVSVDGKWLYGKSVTKYDAATGSVVWVRNLPGCYGVPVVFGSDVYYNGNSVCAVSASSGALLWQSTSAGMTSPLAVAGGLVFALTDAGVIALNAESGKLVWQSACSGVCTWGSYSGLVTTANGVVYVDEGSSVVMLNTSNGAHLGTLFPPSGFEFGGEAIPVNGHVYVVAITPSGSRLLAYEP